MLLPLQIGQALRSSYDHVTHSLSATFPPPSSHTAQDLASKVALTGSEVQHTCMASKQQAEPYAVQGLLECPGPSLAWLLLDAALFCQNPSSASCPAWRHLRKHQPCLIVYTLLQHVGPCHFRHEPCGLHTSQ